MNIFDAIILGITIILGIKGFLNGIIKELSGLIGIVGGLFVASIYFHQVGIYINDYILKIPNKSAIDLVGFIVIFVGVWLFAIFIGFLLNKMLKISALGVFDRIFGFIFGSLKFFVLVAVVLSLVYQIKIIKEKTQKLSKNSIIFPIMLSLGDEIIHLNPKKVKNVIKNGKILKSFKGE